MCGAYDFDAIEINIRLIVVLFSNALIRSLTSPHHHQQSFAVQRGYKLKRQRQRVDAGEPRNSYQQQGKGFRDEMASDAMSVLFPWMNQNTDLDFVKDDQPTDLSCKDNEKMEMTDTSDEIDQLDVESAEDQTTGIPSDEIPVAEPRLSNESANSTSSSSSSSKRKSFQPQKNTEEAEQTVGDCAEDDGKCDEIHFNEEVAKTDEKPAEENTRHFDGLSALQSQLSQPNMKFTEIFETQRKFYNNLLEQQKKFFSPPQPMEITPEKPSRARDFTQLAQTLKNEIIDSLSGSIDKVLKEWAANEMARLQHESARPAAMPPMFNPLFPAPNPLAAHFGMNPHMPPAGIFPAPLNPFNSLAALNQMRKPFEEDGPKKKRSKVTDSVRKLNGTPIAREGSPSSTRSSPVLSHSTPLSNYFPPTMVGHPLYGGATFGEREGSPTNSDEASECGAYDSGQSSTLTPVHLRKAKLMFFYTRYPNSTLLKSYFPDVRFNKNNTAQLVKWFSNFSCFKIRKKTRELVFAPNFTTVLISNSTSGFFEIYRIIGPLKRARRSDVVVGEVRWVI
uniref:Prospero domain-containing protein n=1 Tax=Angiostrongylus cantonensis TaxID=6313 RepID=A0A158P8T9_ANGCA